MAVELHLRRYGETDGQALVLLHGLFGSGANWHGIARRLERRHRILVPDLRNHGDSPSDPVMTYPAMAGDLAELLAAERITRAVVVGHSMGGKAAMWLALSEPERIAAVVIVDIAPVPYPGGFETLIDALLVLPLSDIADRKDADRRLAARIPDAAVRGYLLQNLRHDDSGGWGWRCNLTDIAAALPALLDFPDAEGQSFAGPALFLYGTDSSYIGGDVLGTIRALFPHARLRAVPNAGHWVYADQPEAFVGALSGFLDRI
jgi:pimeloyl-ACP methyl ester carboxylesterase